VSPSKKANKPATSTKNKSAQKKTETSSVRSSHAEEQSRTTESIQTVGAQKKRNSLATGLLRILALLAVVGITVYIFSIRDQVEQFKQWGYGGIFLVALLANATVLLPAPGVAVIYAMGAIFNPFGVALAAGTGGALGELSGYLAGFSGQGVIERMDVYERIKPWVDKYGGWAILVLSAIPNPLFDVAGIAAGIAKMPLHTFLIFTWVGQLIKMSIFALAGYYSVELYSDYFK
jgi:membrane protein DedA with SNARE-associated domain